MKTTRYYLLFLILAVCISCEQEMDNSIILDRVDGYVQKGPFLNGTEISIYELNDNLVQTGKTFSSQILDNKGSFEIDNVNLISKFAELKADGFYFNEIKNENSAARLSLYALSDLSEKSSLNVNLLSSLEKSRVEYLISDGIDFYSAKKQAQKEILEIFNIEKVDIMDSELLDISKTGEDNAILLAVSLILQSYLSVSELSELLANISTDIREDGILNSENLGSVLVNNATKLKMPQIRTHLEDRYESLGLEVTIPDFESYVNHFINTTEYEFSDFILYPAEGSHGLNLLDSTVSIYLPGHYSLHAIIPEGSKLKVKISGDIFWFFSPFQDNSGWMFSDWNNSDNSRVFTSTRSGEVDFKIMLENPEKRNQKIKLDVYENDDIDPTWGTVAIMEGTEQLNNEIIYPEFYEYGPNILAMEDPGYIISDSIYSLVAEFPSNENLRLELKLMILEGDLSWVGDESEYGIWSGIPTEGDIIYAEATGETAYMPIKFTGSGRIELQLHTFRLEDIPVYLKTRTIQLFLQE